MIIRGMNLPLTIACIVIVLALIILPLIVSYKAEKKEKNKYLSFLINFPYLVPTIFIFSVFSLILTMTIPESDDFVDEKELLENLVEIENKEVFLEDQKEKSTLENTSLTKIKEVENVTKKSTEIEPDIIKIVVSE